MGTPEDVGESELKLLSVALGIEHWENRDVIMLRELRSMSPSASVVGAKPCTY
jgi:hypothetical protein